jgi:phosphoribosylformylglycinamidine synthase subunit PurS
LPETAGPAQTDTDHSGASMKARITVTLKNGVLDPQGKAIEHALLGLGFDGIGSVRQGKVFDVELAGTDKAKAEADLKAMCDRLLANTVIENYSVTLT